MKSWEDVAGPVITDPLVVHDERLAPLYLEKLMKRRDLRGSVGNTPNLTILTWSNYPKQTILEESVSYLGAECVVLGKGLPTFPLNAKITLTLEYLESGACGTDLVLWIDSRDAVLLADPARIVRLFEESDCEALFSTTDFPFPGCGPIHAVERSFPEAKDSLTPYLNSGVVIGNKEFLIEILREAKAQLALPPLSPFDPKNDQPVFALIYTKLHPRIKVNADQRLALRPFMNDVYLFALESNAGGIRESWAWQWLAILKQFFTRKDVRRALVRYPWTSYERQANGWAVRKRLMKLKLLFSVRSDYTRVIRMLRESSWMQ